MKLFSEKDFRQNWEVFVEYRPPSNFHRRPFFPDTVHNSRKHGKLTMNSAVLHEKLSLIIAAIAIFKFHPVLSQFNVKNLSVSGPLMNT